MQNLVNDWGDGNGYIQSTTLLALLPLMSTLDDPLHQITWASNSQNMKTSHFLWDMLRWLEFGHAQLFASTFLGGSPWSVRWMAWIHITWCPHDIHMICTWYTRDIHMIFTWYSCDPHVSPLSPPSSTPPTPYPLQPPTLWRLLSPSLIFKCEPEGSFHPQLPSPPSPQSHPPTLYSLQPPIPCQLPLPSLASKLETMSSCNPQQPSHFIKLIYIYIIPVTMS